MSTKRFYQFGVRVVVVTFVLAAALLFVLQVKTLIAGEANFSGRTESYQYSGHVDGKGGAYVTVSTNWESQAAIDEYVKANLLRGQELVAADQSLLVPVQITFHKPMNVQVVRELVGATGFQVESFALVGYNSAGNERSVHVAFQSDFEGISTTVSSDPETGSEVSLQGIMVVQGSVPANESGLGVWLAHPAAFLVDTSELDVANVVRSRHGTQVGDSSLEVVLESPFWLLDW
jgi:hypothetical protein